MYAEYTAALYYYLFLFEAYQSIREYLHGRIRRIILYVSPRIYDRQHTEYVLQYP